MDFSLSKEKILKEEVCTDLKRILEAYNFFPIESAFLENADLNISMIKRIIEETDKNFTSKIYQKNKENIALGTIGSKSILRDSEIIALMDSIFSSLGIPVLIKVNNRKLIKFILEKNRIEVEKHPFVISIIDKLEKLGEETIKEELLEKGIEERAIDQIFEIFALKGKREGLLIKIKNEIGDCEGIRELEELFKTLQDFALENEYVFEPSLGNGSELYIGNIFEVILKDSILKTPLARGGRLDKNYQIVKGILELAPICKMIKKEIKTKTKVLVVPIGEKIKEAIRLTQKLRFYNINTELGSSKGLEKGIEFSLFVGEELKLKDMKTGEEKALSVDEIINSLKN
ncbi:MAG: ATP phosphoribosyltransferase regulatory subunit [archaeon]